MKIIDFHNHLLDEPDFADGLVCEMDRLGIEKTCLSGLGRICRMQDDEAVLRAVQAHPDRIVGFVFVRPGHDTKEKIARYHELGFRGVKVTCPAKSYDAVEYHALWETACRLKMPVLFHTGVVTALGAVPEDDISSERMRPHLLEPIARAFPELNLVMAHCGISFTMDISDIIRLIPNIYCDISGAAGPGGWRSRLTPERFTGFFWWPDAYRKILFGTDVHWRDMGDVLAADRALYAGVGLTNGLLDDIFAGTAERLLNGEDPPVAG
ncbi:MAG: amidohydrolase family protein [Kiritimatiellae bacterium]|nr:amidohydrolase family protein [Kiritimatiellia bacterium]